MVRKIDLIDRWRIVLTILGIATTMGLILSAGLALSSPTGSVSKTVLWYVAIGLAVATFLTSGMYWILHKARERLVKEMFKDLDLVEFDDF